MILSFSALLLLGVISPLTDAQSGTGVNVPLDQRLISLADSLQQYEDENSDIPFMGVSRYYRKLAMLVSSGTLQLEAQDIQDVSEVIDSQETYISRTDEATKGEQQALTWIKKGVDAYSGQMAWIPKTMMEFGMLVTGYTLDSPTTTRQLRDTLRDELVLNELMVLLGDIDGAMATLQEAENLVVSVLGSDEVPNNVELDIISEKLGEAGTAALRQNVQETMRRLVMENVDDADGRKAFYGAARKYIALTLSYRNAKYMMAGMFGLNDDYRNMAQANLQDVSNMYDDDREFMALLNPNSDFGVTKFTAYYPHDGLTSNYLESLGMSTYSDDANLPFGSGCYNVALTWNDRMIINPVYDVPQFDIQPWFGTPVRVIRERDENGAPTLSFSNYQYKIYTRGWAGRQILEFSSSQVATKFYAVSKRKRCIDTYDVVLKTRQSGGKFVTDGTKLLDLSSDEYEVMKVQKSDVTEC